jgi:hypothetical protein
MTSLGRPAAWLLAQGGVLLYLWAPSLLPGALTAEPVGIAAWAPFVVPPLLYIQLVLWVPSSSVLRRLAGILVLLGLHAGLGVATAAVYSAAKLGSAPGPLDPAPWGFPLVPVLQLLSVPLVALPLRQFLIRSDGGDAVHHPAAPPGVTATPTPVRRGQGWDETGLHTVGGEQRREDDTLPPGAPERRPLRREPTRPFRAQVESAAGPLASSPTPPPTRSTWPPRAPAPLDGGASRQPVLPAPPAPGASPLPSPPSSEVAPVPRVEAATPVAAVSAAPSIPAEVAPIEAPLAPPTRWGGTLSRPVASPSIDDDVLASVAALPGAVVVREVTDPERPAAERLPVVATTPISFVARCDAPAPVEIDAPTRAEVEAPAEPVPPSELAPTTGPPIGASPAAAGPAGLSAEQIVRALAGAGSLTADTHAVMGIVVYTACSPRLAEDAVVRATFRFLSVLAESPSAAAVTQTTIRGAAGAMVLTPLGPLGAGGPVLAAAIPQRGQLALLEILSLRVAAEYRAREPGATSLPAGPAPVSASPGGLDEAPVPPRVERLARSLAACGPLRPLGFMDPTGQLLLYVLTGPGAEARGIGRFAADLYRVLEIDGDPGGVGPFQSVVVRLGDHRVVVRPVAEAPGHSTVLVAACPASDRPGLVQLQIERAAARLAAPPG